MSLSNLKEIAKEGENYPIDEAVVSGKSTIFEGFSLFDLTFKDGDGNLQKIKSIVPWKIEESPDMSYLRYDGIHYFLGLKASAIKTAREEAKKRKNKTEKNQSWLPDHSLLAT